MNTQEGSRLVCSLFECPLGLLLSRKRDLDAKFQFPFFEAINGIVIMNVDIHYSLQTSWGNPLVS